MELTTSSKGMTAVNPLAPIPASALDMRLDPVRFPRISTMNREDAIDLMIGVVRAAAIYRGAHIDSEDLVNTATALVDEILADTRLDLRNISFAEIRRAVRTSCLETEMYGVNVASIYRAIVTYATGEGKAAADQAKLLSRRNATPSAPQIAIDAYAAELARNSQK